MIICYLIIWLIINYYERFIFVCYCGVVSIGVRVFGKIGIVFVLVLYYMESIEVEVSIGICN